MLDALGTYAPSWLGVRPPQPLQIVNQNLQIDTHSSIIRSTKRNHDGLSSKTTSPVFDERKRLDGRLRSSLDEEYLLQKGDCAM